MRCRTIASILVTAGVLVACGQQADESGRNGSAPSSTVQVTPVLPTDLDDAPASTTTVEVEARSLPPLPPTTVPSAELPSVTVPPSTAPSTTPVTTTEPRSTVPPTTVHEPFAVSWSRPTGSLTLEASDVVALGEDGSLVLFHTLEPPPATPEVLVADVTTVLGKAEIDSVGGVIDGALVFGTCCGDDAALWSVSTDGGQPRRFAAGHLAAYDAARNWLIAVGSDGDKMLVHDVPSALVTSPTFAEGAGANSPRGVIWAADGKSWFISVRDGSKAGELVQIDATPPFAELSKTSLDAVFPDASTDPTFAGLGPTGDIGMSASVGGSVVLRFIDAATKKARPSEERTLPSTATSVGIGPDGGSLIWIDGGALRSLRLFADEQTLGNGYVAAWYVG